MPCNDVTDQLQIRLDAEDRIVSYQLSKRTCGGEVGQYALIEPWVKNRCARDYLKATPDELFAAYPPHDDTHEFLLLKHFFAIRSGLSSFYGLQESGINDPCTVDRINSGPEGVELTASLKVEMITKNIQACHGCGCRQK